MRYATPGDEDALTALEREAMGDAVGPVLHGPFPDDIVRERWRAELIDPAVTVVLACDPGPVAYLAHDGRTLLHVGVVPSQQGTGLADALLERLPEAVARLWVLEPNARARRYYERRGWRPDGRTQPCAFAPFPTELGYSRQEARS